MSDQESTTKIERNPDETRQKILMAAFEEVFKNGYQGMRLDEVIAVTGLTKGALYHHFSSKLTLGYAVVDEVITPIIKAVWEDNLADADDPLAMIIEIINSLPDSKPMSIVEYGCPLNNLAQEMSPLDEGFRQRLDASFTIWSTALVTALQKAKDSGSIRADINCEETATFIMAALEGCIGLAKNAQSKERLITCNRGLTDYLQSLKT